MSRIQEIKDFMKANNITYQQLCDDSGIPLNTIKNIFRGKTQHPRIDTMQAIERALGLDGEKEKAPAPELTDGERELFELISQLTEQEIDELSNFVDFILSKRK